MTASEIDKLVSGFETLTGELAKVRDDGSAVGEQLGKIESLMAVISFLEEAGVGNLARSLDDLCDDLVNGLSAGNRKTIQKSLLHQKAAAAVDILICTGTSLPDALAQVSRFTNGTLSAKQLQTLRANYRSDRIRGAEGYRAWMRVLTSSPIEERTEAARALVDVMASSIRDQSERLRGKKV